MNTPKIKVYTTSLCYYCQLTKDFLRERGLKFEEINIGNDPKSAQEMIQKSKQMGVPVIDINGKIIVGFDREEILNALK